MSIVKYVKDELPKEGAIVYCDNGVFSSDRAVFEGGEFVGGGEFPVPNYKMSQVSKWFDLKEYDDHFKSKGETAYYIRFITAETITA